MVNVYEAVSANKRKSWFVIAGFIIFITLAAIFIAQGLAHYYGYSSSWLGVTGLALIISGAISFASYYWSDKIILGLSGARPADRRRDFNFFTVAENLSLAAGLPTPKLYVIEDTALNAFATGRDPSHAVICATTGLLAKLDRTELEGVVGHEMSHITNYDMRLMSVVTILIGLVTLLADWLLRASFFGGHSRDRNNRETGAIFMILGLILAVLSPIVAQIIQLAISRSREYLADASAVKLTRQPQGLISALQKLGQDREPLEAANKATAHLYIVNPFHLDSSSHKPSKGPLELFSNLFNTHPPLTERIKALQAMT